MRRICFLLLISVFIVSCSVSIEKDNSNETIRRAIATLNSVTTNTDVTIKLTGTVTEQELLQLKEALVALEYKSLGNGFLTVDMTELSNVKTMDPQYFGNLDMLKSVNLPESLTEVTKYLFYGCRHLKSVTIEENVKYIGYAAFANCEKLDTLFIKPGILEIRTQAFVDLNNSIKLITVPDFVMYCLDGPAFDNSAFNTFGKFLPVKEAYPVSRLFISDKGEEKTVNLSFKYSSDSDYLYLLVQNKDKPEENPKKVVTMLRAEDANLFTSETDMDGFLADAAFGKNQKITVTEPTDGSKWYITKHAEVFYSWDKGRAWAIPFPEGQRIVTYNNLNEYYFFKAK